MTAIEALSPPSYGGARAEQREGRELQDREDVQEHDAQRGEPRNRADGEEGSTELKMARPCRGSKGDTI